MYCSDSTTWATIDDLIHRYGEEEIDKLSTRRIYNPELGSYIADESKEGRLRVQVLALCDAKDLIIEKLNCKFKNVDLLDKKIFPSIKQWHIKLTIETLKIGGDCRACACNEELNKYIDCSSICTEDGECLISKKTFIKVTRDKFKCDFGGCGCC